jgi:hypothetical protein
MTPSARRVNEELHNLGLTYWSSLSAAMEEVSNAVESNGFEVLHGWPTSTPQRLHLELTDGKWLSLSYYRMESGNYEVTAYVN